MRYQMGHQDCMYFTLGRNLVRQDHDFQVHRGCKLKSTFFVMFYAKRVFTSTYDAQAMPVRIPFLLWSIG